MPTSHCRVLTTQGSRYLQQLCKHWAHKFRVEFTPARGEIDFGDGRSCLLEAAEDALSLRATVPEGADAARFEEVIAEHIRRFAFREDLAFAWDREA